MSKRRFNGKRRSKLARQVSRNKFKISKIANVIERKQIAVAQTDQDANTTGTIQTLSVISHGITQSTRIGDTIVIKSITIRGFLHNDQGTPVDNIVRLIVWKNLNPNGVTEVINANVLESVTVNALRDWDHKLRIKVYYDQTFVMDTSQHTLIPFKIRIAGLRSKVTYEGTGGGELDSMMNHYYFGLISTVAGTTNDPLVDFDFRVTYDDA